MLLDRADIARLAEAYRPGDPEGMDGRPMLDVRMSPQAALWLMSLSGAAHLEADVVVATPAGYVAVTPETASDGPSGPMGTRVGDTPRMAF